MNSPRNPRPERPRLNVWRSAPLRGLALFLNVYLGFRKVRRMRVGPCSTPGYHSAPRWGENHAPWWFRPERPRLTFPVAPLLQAKKIAQKTGPQYQIAVRFGVLARGADEIRTHDGGFAIRCLSHLATAPECSCMHCLLRLHYEAT